ncbi:MAG: hypothetical protein ABI378_03255 [Chitinophagaceae bacterium]
MYSLLKADACALNRLIDANGISFTTAEGQKETLVTKTVAIQ